MIDSHHFAGGLHLRTQHRVHPREAVEGKDHLFYRHVGHLDLAGEAQILQSPPDHHLGRQLGQGHTRRLGDKRNGPGSPGVDLQDVNPVVPDGKLNVHQPLNPKLPGQGVGIILDRLHEVIAQGIRRKNAGAVPGMDPRLFDMLHDAADDDPLPVGDGIHIHFDGLLQELVDQDRPLGGGHHRLPHVPLQGFLGVNDLHRPPSQDIGGPNHHGVPDFPGYGPGLFEGSSRSILGLDQTQFLDEFLEALPVFGPVDAVRRGPQNPHPRIFQGHRQVQGSLAAKLDNDPLGHFPLHDIKHILPGEGLKIKAVGNIIIGGDRLRVAVHHDGFVPLFPQGEGGMNAAVIEFDPLADPVGASPQDQDLFLPRRATLVLRFVGGVIIWGIGFELGGAGVHQLKGGEDSQGLAPLPHLHLLRAQKMGELDVGVSPLFGLAKERCR